uniref:Uncharacterized protein n=1 Tax=Physcomitrium patens TaxID=3218 RepID=A0A2K1JUA6_PHYPA|nr:hypothetical protein PHYPA_014882 [Physcomitrium patens]
MVNTPRTEIFGYEVPLFLQVDILILALLIIVIQRLFDFLLNVLIRVATSSKQRPVANNDLGEVGEARGLRLKATDLQRSKSGMMLKFVGGTML